MVCFLCKKCILEFRRGILGVGGKRVGCEEAEGFRGLNLLLKDVLRDLDGVIVGVDVVGIGSGGNGVSACWAEDFGFIRLVEWDRCRVMGMVGVRCADCDCVRVAFLMKIPFMPRD